MFCAIFIIQVNGDIILNFSIILGTFSKLSKFILTIEIPKQSSPKITVAKLVMIGFLSHLVTHTTMVVDIKLHNTITKIVDIILYECKPTILEVIRNAIVLKIACKKNIDKNIPPRIS